MSVFPSEKLIFNFCIWIEISSINHELSNWWQTEFQKPMAMIWLEAVFYKLSVKFVDK